ncbi:MAG: type IV pilus assembly protein PilM [Eubacteriales bacterium]|nr:type IV pilus assembly protein PilM [Bacillota bacterium]MBV1726653.1 type IV pilus assembly protein PilM [Desulforudis sp.]MDP3051762.1 type IV pilus assembly protein PilM [Eubacteriales bacterium]MBV1735142.1 type IV pilus assembly protein PilM [Desulforudis sp.]MDZ4042478.1 type IV pilus assembly protein PilM [Eubacteriales bacterium]
MGLNTKVNVKELLGRFLPKQTVFAAVDYGTRSIKTASVSTAGPRPMLLQLSRVAQPVTVGDEPGLDARVNLLAEAIELAGMKNQEVIATLGADKVITRHLQLPLMPEKELAAAVSFEAEKLIPVPLSDLIVRYVKLGETEGGEGKQQEVLLAAVPLDVVHGFYELFVQAGVTITALDLQPLALWRALSGVVGSPGSPPDEVSAIVDIGAVNTTLIVVHQGALLFWRSLAVGGDLLTKSMAEAYGISFEEAQTLKEESGKVLSTEEAAEVISPEEMQLDFSLRDGLGEVVREIRRSLDFYAGTKGARSVERIVLSGGGSNLQGFALFLADALGIPSKIGALPVDIPPGAGDEMPYQDPAMFMSVGLALREAGVRSIQK